MSSGNLGRDGIKVLQIGDFAISVEALKIMLMFNFKNIATSTTPGLRDDCLGAMISYSYSN